MQRLEIVGLGFELLGGVMMMRKADVPVRLHTADLAELYSAGIIPANVSTEMIEGVVYLAAKSADLPRVGG